MEQTEIRRLLKRRDKAAAQTAQWMALLKEAYRYAIPNRNVWDKTEVGQNRNDDIYDTTLVSATKKFVHNTVNALMPPDRQFLKLVAGAEVPEENEEEVNRDLQKITDTFFFYLNRSNFSLTIYEALLDMSISTGVMQINEGDDDNPLIFSAVPSDKISFETGPRGDFIAFYRDWPKLKPEYVEELWGKDVKVPQKYSNMQEPELTVYEISFWCYKDKVYKYVLIDKDTSELMLFEKNESWPWVAFRMNRLAGEDRGRGVVLDALPSAMTINKAIYDELAAAAMQANPTYMAYTDSIINPYNFKIEPNAIIPVQRGGSETWPIAPLPQAGNLNFTALVVNDLRQQINEIMMVQPLTSTFDAPDRTATEVAVNQNMLRENASAAFNRLQRELFDPVVKRVLHILKLKGLVPDIKIDGKIVDITYATPLAQSKEHVDLQNFMSFYQTISGILGPQIAPAAINLAKIPRWIGEKLNSDLDLIKDEAEILQLMQQGMEALEQQQDEQP